MILHYISGNAAEDRLTCETPSWKVEMGIFENPVESVSLFGRISMFDGCVLMFKGESVPLYMASGRAKSKKHRTDQCVYRHVAQ